jgi:hypothetical protein
MTPIAGGMLVRIVSVIAVTGLFIVSENGIAGSLFDYIRNYDLNDYALGLGISAKQNSLPGRGKWHLCLSPINFISTFVADR